MTKIFRSYLAIVFSGVLLNLCLTSAQAAWKMQNPGATSNSLYGIWGNSENDVFAVGLSGTIIHYNGSSWSSLTSGTSIHLRSVWGNSNNNVFAVGGDGNNRIILHYDSSAWSTVETATGTNYLYSGVWGSASNDVFIVGYTGTIRHYDGSNWSTMTVPGTPNLLAVWGSSGSDVFAVGLNGTILHYNGTAWSAMASGTTVNLRGVWGSSDSDVFAVGDTGTILRYNGTDWSSLSSGTTQSLEGVWGNSGTDVFAVGHDGKTLHYNGSGWTAMATPTNQILYGAWGTSGSHVIAVGQDGTILNYDGSSWSSTGTVTAQSLTGVWGSSGSDVFAVGPFDVILHHNDTAWSTMTISTIGGLNGVWGSSGTDVFAVGFNGLILHYNGTVWSAMGSPSDANFFGVWGSSGYNVFAVGDSGTILHYNGILWSMTIAAGVFRGVWGSSASDVFAVGFNGFPTPVGDIQHYDGSSWSSMSIGTTAELWGVWGTSGNDVFAVGQGGLILHYDGSTWSTMTSNTTQTLKGVWGTSGSDVFAVGESGTIQHYDGSTWSTTSSGTTAALQGVWGSSGSDIYAVGSSGTILHYTPGDTPTVTTTAASSIGTTTATGNGNITSLGVPNPNAHGVCWNTSGSPTISDDYKDNGAATATGPFTANMTGLSPNTTYYVRAFATNSIGTSYGSNETFTTAIAPGTYYVDIQNGNDSNDGSLAHPWKTLHHAIAQINGGSPGTYTLHVASGTYKVGNGENDAQLMITQDNVTIDGADSPKSVIDATGAEFWTDGLRIDNGSNVVIKDLILQNFTVASSGITIDTGSNNTIQNCDIDHNEYGVHIRYGGNNIVRNCSVYNNIDKGIYVYGSDTNLIHNNTIYDNGIGIHVRSDCYGSPAYPENNEIYENIIYWSGDTYHIQDPGIQFSGDDECSVGDGNRIYQNEIYGPTGGTSCTAVHLYDASTNTEILKNQVHDLHKGIYSYYDGSAAEAPRMVNNLIHHVQYGIYLEAGSGTVKTATVRHNTVADGTNTGITFGGSPELTYNIVTGFNDFGLLGQIPSGSPMIDYNDVWNNHLNYSGCSAGPNDISLDPMYGSYSLQPCSPCIDAVDISDPVTEDINGTTRPQGPWNDMGAYEYTYQNPVIDSFSPPSGATGTSVTIDGSHFCGASGVTLGGTPAASFTVVSDIQISADVGNGSTGKVAVTTPGGIGTSSSNFTFINPPTITSFTPTSGGQGTSVTITGTNFTGASAVNFGGTAASTFSIDSATQITATVGTGTTGKVAVTTPGGTATSSTDFTFTGAPTITSFTPTSGGTGTTVTITGTGFTGTEVKFGGTDAASFTVDSDTQITASVGTGSTGKVTVTTPGGTGTSSNNFTFINAPTITSFSPTSGGAGTTVTITGTHFTGTAVKFGGTNAASFTVDSATQITAVVGSGSTGKVTVTTSGGTATSTASFTFTGAFNYTLPGGTGVSTDYRIFTVPLYLGSGADMLTAMENTLGTYAPSHWRVFAFMGANYVEINSQEFAALSIIPGMGFWIITLYTDTVPFQGGLAPDQVDYEIVLPPGWSLIALPWISTNIDLGNITVSSGESRYPITSESNTLTQRSLWDYTGSGPYNGYEKRNTSDYALQCGTAYFIKVLSASSVTVSIPPDNGSEAVSVQPYWDTEGPIPGDDEEEPPPPPGGEPIPDIKANGQDGPVTVPYGTPVSIAVSLEPGAWANRNVDWWVAAQTPFDLPENWYTYVYPDVWYPGVHVCIQTPLFQLSPSFEVLNMALPIGNYAFHFAIDGNADGLPDVSWVDSVEVKVE